MHKYPMVPMNPSLQPLAVFSIIYLDRGWGEGGGGYCAAHLRCLNGAPSMVAVTYITDGQLSVLSSIRSKGRRKGVSTCD